MIQLSAAFIRVLREALGDSQDAFAARMGVSKFTVQRWETTKRQPQPYHIKRLRNLAKRHGVKEATP